ncbi:MAG: hypothetical protein RID91_13545 [Azospirillaceae bacterium]
MPRSASLRPSLAALAAALAPLPTLAQDPAGLGAIQEERWVGWAVVQADVGVTAAVCGFGDEPPAPRPWEDDALPSDTFGAGAGADRPLDDRASDSGPHGVAGMRTIGGGMAAGAESPPMARPSVPGIRARLLEGLAAVGASTRQIRRILGRFDVAVARRRGHEVALATMVEGGPGLRFGGIFATDGCSRAVYRRLSRLAHTPPPGPW